MSAWTKDSLRSRSAISTRSLSTRRSKCGRRCERIIVPTPPAAPVITTFIDASLYSSTAIPLAFAPRGRYQTRTHATSLEIGIPWSEKVRAQAPRPGVRAHASRPCRHFLRPAARARHRVALGALRSRRADPGSRRVRCPLGDGRADGCLAGGGASLARGREGGDPRGRGRPRDAVFRHLSRPPAPGRCAGRRGAAGRAAGGRRVRDRAHACRRAPRAARRAAAAAARAAMAHRGGGRAARGRRGAGELARLRRAGDGGRRARARPAVSPRGRPSDPGRLAVDPRQRGRAGQTPRPRRSARLRRGRP